MLPVCFTANRSAHSSPVVAQRYGVRCVTVGQTRFRWRDDSAIMSEEALWLLLNAALTRFCGNPAAGAKGNAVSRHDRDPEGLGQAWSDLEHGGRRGKCNR